MVYWQYVDSYFFKGQCLVIEPNDKYPPGSILVFMYISSKLCSSFYFIGLRKVNRSFYKNNLYTLL